MAIGPQSGLKAALLQPPEGQLRCEGGGLAHPSLLPHAGAQDILEASGSSGSIRGRGNTGPWLGWPGPVPTQYTDQPCLPSEKQNLLFTVFPGEGGGPYSSSLPSP